MSKESKIIPTRTCREQTYKMKSIKKFDPEQINVKNVDKKIIDSLLEVRKGILIPQFENLKPDEELEITVISCLGKGLYHIEFISAQGKVCRAIGHYSEKKAVAPKYKNYKMKSIRRLNPDRINVKNVDREIIVSLLKRRKNILIPQFKNLKPDEELGITVISYLGQKLYYIEVVSAKGKIYRAIGHYSERMTPQENKKINRRNGILGKQTHAS